MRKNNMGVMEALNAYQQTKAQAFKIWEQSLAPAKRAIADAEQAFELTMREADKVYEENVAPARNAFDRAVTEATELANVAGR